jgi:hypothetical protein
VSSQIYKREALLDHLFSISYMKKSIFVSLFMTVKPTKNQNSPLSTIGLPKSRRINAQINIETSKLWTNAQAPCSVHPLNTVAATTSSTVR